MWGKIMKSVCSDFLLPLNDSVCACCFVNAIYHQFRGENDLLCGVKRSEGCCIKQRRDVLHKNTHLTVRNISKSCSENCIYTMRQKEGQTHIEIFLWGFLSSVLTGHTAAIFRPSATTASPLLEEKPQSECISYVCVYLEYDCVCRSVSPQ